MSESVCIMNGNVEGLSGNARCLENNCGHAEGPLKTAKQLEKEAKKVAKLEKFKQKKERQQTVQTKENVEVYIIGIICGSFTLHMAVHDSKRFSVFNKSCVRP
jgi:activator of 2-hydroxyglutaryl-CoA dehydratase